MASQQKKYDNEFIERSVKLAITNPQSYSQTARELGISLSTLHGWIQKYQDQGIKNDPKTQNVFEELKNLRKEVAKLREEREILKKAAAFFAKEQK